MKFVELNDNNKMPILGYGVFQIPPQDTQKCVEDAISVGYRAIDTAQTYRNEEQVGAAVNSAIKGGTKRSEFFVTTKIWVSNATEDGVLRSFDKSMQKLGLDYLDLLLLHQQYGDVYGAWRAMSRLKKEGRIRSIGVSNFYPDRLMDFSLCNEIRPAINQIELNPLYQREFDRKIASELGVAIGSWASFGEGRQGILDNKILKNIGEKYGKSVAQVILRWLVQQNIVVIPKTTKIERMRENFSVFDFELSETDMKIIASMDEKKTLFGEFYKANSKNSEFQIDPSVAKFMNSYKLDD